MLLELSSPALRTLRKEEKANGSPMDVLDWEETQGGATRKCPPPPSLPPPAPACSLSHSGREQAARSSLSVGAFWQIVQSRLDWLNSFLGGLNMGA